VDARKQLDGAPLRVSKEETRLFFWLGSKNEEHGIKSWQRLPTGGEGTILDFKRILSCDVHLG
jgi:hypothetical protein